LYVSQAPQKPITDDIDAQEIFGSKRSSGVLLANPISDEFSIPKEEIDVAINQAVKEAAEQGFHGHANTPFILARIKDLTAGRSIPVNRALIQRNVEMAAKVAVELTKFRQYGVKAGSATDTDPPTEPSNDIFSMPIRNVRQKMSEMQDSLGSLTSQLSVSMVLFFPDPHVSRLVLSSYVTRAIRSIRTLAEDTTGS
jgi:hypothetical protein